MILKERRSNIFEIIKILEEHKISFDIKRCRPDSVMIVARFVGEVTEIDVFEDGQIEVSRFTGSEAVDAGLDVVLRVLDERTDPADRE